MGSKPQSIVGANAGRSRSHNRQVVLERVRAAGAMGRAEIARSSGLSTQAVSNIIAELEADGLLREQGRRSAGRGFPAVQYALNPDGGYALGIEVRPDAVIGALLNLNGQTLFSRRVAIGDASPDAVIAKVVRLRDRALTETAVPPHRVMGVGVVMPGPIGMPGLSAAGSELPDWQGVDPAELFSQALDVRVFVENDANAAAMAERISGVAKELTDYAFLYFGTGLGLGIVSGGRLERGAFGNAGEIGHVPVITPGGPASLEDVVSRLSVRRHLLANGTDVTSGEDLTRLFELRDTHLLDWLEAASEPLSYAIQMIENLFDPEAVILGGAMPDPLLDFLISQIRLADASVSNRPNRSAPRLLRGSLGRFGATLGGAALVINQSFTPQIAAE